MEFTDEKHMDTRCGYCGDPVRYMERKVLNWHEDDQVYACLDCEENDLDTEPLPSNSMRLLSPNEDPPVELSKFFTIEDGARALENLTKPRTTAEWAEAGAEISRRTSAPEDQRPLCFPHVMNKGWKVHVAAPHSTVAAMCFYLSHFPSEDD